MARLNALPLMILALLYLASTASAEPLPAPVNIPTCDTTGTCATQEASGDVCCFLSDCTVSVGNCTDGYCIANAAGVCWGTCAVNVAGYCEGVCLVNVASTCFTHCAVNVAGLCLGSEFAVWAECMASNNDEPCEIPILPIRSHQEP